MGQSSILTIGIHGSVVALDRTTGQEVWRTKLKGADFVTVVLEDRDLFAATAGELFCLDPVTGAIRWHNNLTGLGLGLISIAVPGDGQSVVMRQKQQQDEAAAGAAQ